MERFVSGPVMNDNCTLSKREVFDAMAATRSLKMPTGEDSLSQDMLARLEAYEKANEKKRASILGF